MRNFFYTAFILAFFYWIGTATSIDKDFNYPCGYQINNYLSKDTIVRSYYSSAHNDTIVISAYKDSLWESKSAAVCQILKDSCNTPAYKILVIDTSYNQATWNTPYGKQIYFRQCP